MNLNRLVALAAALCAGGLAAGLLGQSMLFGMGTMILISLLAVIGFGRRASKLTLIAVAAFGALFCFLIYLNHALHTPEQPLVTFAGFPLGTAVLVYAIGPLGLILGALYALSFDSEVLSEKRQKDFLDRFGSRK